MADRPSSDRLAQALDAAAASLERLEREKREAIAVVGMACRFPGAASPEAFWQLLDDGSDAVTEIPAERWDLDQFYDPDPDRAGTMYSRHGAFLADVRGFDAALFRISRREAVSMDPQQRILLEVTWEALERAGISPRAVRGTAASVHVGVTTHDYSQLLLAGARDTPLDTYYATGNAPNALAGRLSYTLGLNGPSMVVDTACSSSLVAVHLACQALRSGESDLALAGGVNLILSPQLHAALCRARMLSPSGRCRTFSADADGYVRGEGCGVVVLKRLSDAVGDCDRVLAVVRGSAVNQDGASAGFTVPHGPSQQALMRRALEAAQIDAGDVSYLEAHGTGTPLGDPIEVNAAAAVYGPGRDRSRPLVMGSVKTNFGHLEAAAGIAGLIKVVLALQARRIPAHLHLSQPNPDIPFSTLPIEVPSRSIAWEGEGNPLIAAISSFGASGTNAHAVLEEAPPEAAGPGHEAAAGDHTLLLSADSPQALHDLVRAYRGFLQSHPEVPLADLCHTAAMGRAHMDHRCAVTGSTVGSVQEKLAAILDGGTGPGIAAGHVRGDAAGSEPEAVALERIDLGRAYVEGKAVPWEELFPRRRPIVLPTYPFQHVPYWVPSALPTADLDEDDAGAGIYHCTWEPVELPEPPATLEPCHWLLLGESDASRRIAGGLQARGQSHAVLGVGAGAGPVRDAVSRALAMAPAHLPLRILYVWEADAAAAKGSADAASVTDQALWACMGLVDLVQCLHEIPAPRAARIWVLTRGACPVPASQASPAPHSLAGAALWGLCRTIATEHPAAFGGLLDLAPEAVAEDPDELLACVSGGPDQLAHRGGRVLVPKIHPLAAEVGRGTAPAPIAGDASYLVTGGLGALGLHVAAWLVERGARHLVLVSRQGETPATAEALVALRARGARVRTPRADVADPEQVAAVLREAAQEGPPLRGVFHLAGVLDDRTATRLDRESMAAVLRPKVAGAWNLHRLTADLPLDHFVLFSSLAAVVGPAGQGNYAAANAFLDALAHVRRAAGLSALAVDWGPWEGPGMAGALAADHLEKVKRSGIRPLTPEQALAALDGLLGRRIAQAVVAQVDWGQVLAGERPPFLRDWAGHLAAGEARQAASPEPGGEPVPDEDLPGVVTRLVAEILQVDPREALDGSRPLDEYGMDSLTGTELKNRIASRLGVDLPLGQLIGGVTVSGLVDRVQEQLTAGDRADEEQGPEDDGSETVELVL